MITVLRNARVFDGTGDALAADWDVVVEGERIRACGRGAGAAGGDRVIDCAGRTLLPGLIDAHVHVYAMEVNLLRNEGRPLSLLAHRARAMLENALTRGFTTVRDCGGADFGLALALEQGWFTGPRLFFCGPMLSQTGGHGDFRLPHDRAAAAFGWECGCRAGHIAVTVDGEDALRKAIRDILRRGASFIKFAASGGVTSVGGAIDALPFADAEIRAIVDETVRHKVYCTAHCHPDAGIRRAIELGVHCIEHATMIGPETARLAAQRGTFVVPTVAVIAAIERHGAALGYAPESLAKLAVVRPAVEAGLVNLREAGVTVGFGSDLLGPLEAHQMQEFAAREGVFTPAEILRQATSVNARILGRAGELGVIAPGALADLIVVDGDPLRDLGVLHRGPPPALVMRGGAVVRDAMQAAGRA
ncbi:MAG: amidohydrolase family protein [Burkholderiales bacterium]|nr:amidohydrolase family protein [Burkholderiales bacterium]